MTMLKSDDRNPQVRSLYYVVPWRHRIALVVLGTMMIGSVPAVAWDGPAQRPKEDPVEALRKRPTGAPWGVEDLNAGKIEAAVAAFTYAAANGQVIARWKLGELYAVGDGVLRDDLKAYHISPPPFLPFPSPPPPPTKSWKIMMKTSLTNRT